MAQPYRRSENKFRAAWLIPSGTRSECGKDCPVSSIASDRQGIEPQLCQVTTQFTQWRHAWISAGLLTKSAVRKIDTANEFDLDARPMTPQPFQHICVDWHSSPFHASGCSHVSATQKRACINFW